MNALLLNILFLAAPPTNIMEFYDNWSGIYSEEITVKSQYSIPVWFQENQELLPEGEKDVLDLGCADGFIGKLLRELRPHYRFDGVDLSPKMVQACNQIYASCVCFDLNGGLPQEIQTKRYDVITATSALEFIQDHKQRFKEIVSVLKSNGQFWLTVEKAEPPSIKEVFGIKKVLYSEEEEIRKLLNLTGFKVIKVEEKTAYISPSTQQATQYFCIIAEKL